MLISSFPLGCLKYTSLRYGHLNTTSQSWNQGHTCGSVIEAKKKSTLSATLQVPFLTTDDVRGRRQKGGLGRYMTTVLTCQSQDLFYFPPERSIPRSCLHYHYQSHAVTVRQKFTLSYPSMGSYLPLFI